MRPNKNVSRHSCVQHGGIFSVPRVPKDVLDFSSNINPLGLLPKVRKTVRQSHDILQRYPDSESRLLREALGAHVGVLPSCIIVGNGATEIIYNFCNAFLSEQTDVLIPAPTFGEYEAAAKLAGARPSFFKTMNLNENLAGFLSRLPRNGCAFVCNPNNPTGELLSKKSLQNILRAAKDNNTSVFVDECFIELVPGRDESVVSLCGRYKNLFILRSLTKSFAFAGMRLGYGIGPKQIISILNKIKIPWNVSGLAQKTAPVALSEHSYLERANRVIASETKFLKTEISRLEGFECCDTATNFMLIKTSIDSTILQKRLLKNKILIRDCKSFRGLDGSYIRVAVRTRRDNKRLVEVLASA